MSFKIIGDSCTDPTPALRDAPEYASVPLIIRIGSQEYVDNGMLKTKDIIDRMAACAEGTGTACPAPQWYVDAFGDADDIYVVTLSAELSGSYNSAVQAREIFLEDHPGKNVHIFNSHSASAGQSAVLIKIFELCRAGLPFDEVVRRVDSFIAHMSTVFVLENLDNLRKNGRLNEMQAILTSTLRIKLIMEGTPAGTIDNIGKALTIKQALTKMVDAAYEKSKKHGIEGRTLVIANCNCPDRAAYVRDLALKKMPFRKVEIVNCGGLSTVYAGDGGIIMAF